MSGADSQTNQNLNWWWIRHAPTGRSGCMIGSTDVPAILPDQECLKGFALSLPEKASWIVSPMSRCRQTAEALLQVSHNPDVVPDINPAFVEQDFGAWEEQSYDTPAIRDAAEFWRDPGNTAPPDGESFATMASRVQKEIIALCDHEDFSGVENIVVVAHAGVIRAAVALALDLTPEQALRLQIDPLSLTRTTRYVSSENSSDNQSITWSVQYLNQNPNQNQNQSSAIPVRSK